MTSGRRIAALRLTAMVALAASSALVADSLHPDRAFCPLEAACAAARDSALGRLMGIPTSVLGLVAFGAFFLLTLLRVEWSRRVLRPASVLAAGGAAAFIGYQALVLGAFCPLCLVADAAGLLSAFVALTWPALPIVRSGRPLYAEARTSRRRWAAVAAAVAVAPFAWPRSTSQGWVEIEAPSVPPAIETAVAAPVPEPAPEDPAAPAWSPSAVDRNLALAVAAPTPAAGGADAPEPEPAAARPEPPAAGRPPRSPAAPTPAADPVRPVVIVEYLNAYCPHCRATHARLEQAIRDLGVPVQRHRVYTWGSRDYPLWARACAFAATVGMEERLFEELLRAPNASAGEVYAAARRAGLDTDALAAALRDPTPPQRLVRDRQWAGGAQLKGLPTLDIGRRRLMGEQSEGELRAAIEVAAADLRRARG